VRIELVIRGILDPGTNALINLLQLAVHSELYKECFDKFIGMADLERLELDGLAISSGL
jgi:hypothetical protein